VPPSTYVPPTIKYKDLNVPFFSDFVSSRTNTCHFSIVNHNNPWVRVLTSINLPKNPPRRLNRHWPRDQPRERPLFYCLTHIIVISDCYHFVIIVVILELENKTMFKKSYKKAGVVIKLLLF
jgi:hypothetical protein